MTLQSKVTHYEKELIKFNNAKKMFCENLEELKAKYNGKYVGIAENIIEIGDNREEVKEKIIGKVGYVSMFISKIGGEDKKVYKHRTLRKLVKK